MALSNASDADVAIFFNKHFQLSTSIPDTSKCQSKPVNLERFQALKNELNHVKSLLNNVPLEKWHRHTRNQNPAGFVISTVRKRANPELVTQAWCKFMEILNRFPCLMNNTESDFKTFHLCEAPGAFITSLNHFIKLKKIKVSWSWMASTLNPFYEGNSTGAMINDDRFIINTLNHWDFGPDDTGDIIGNLRYFVEKYRGQMSLVTADGSIDCQADPARQEILVSELHMAEILTALGVLKIGGHFVLKMFTFYETCTHSHLYLLKCLFRAIEVVKPATSKEGNSEVYVICLDFIGLSAKDLEVMIETKSGAHLTDTMEPDFLDTLEQCARYFMEIQVDVIQRNIRSFEQGFDKSAKTRQKKQLADQFIQRHQLDKIPNTDLIVRDHRKLSAHYNSCRQIDERIEEGTFNDRLSKAQNSSRQEHVIQLKNQLLKLYPSWLPRQSRPVEWTPAPSLTKMPLIQMKGRAFDSIHSSKFCTAKAISLYRDSLKYGMLTTEDENLQKKRKVSEKAKYQLLTELILDKSPLLTALTGIYPEIEAQKTFVLQSPCEDLLKNCHIQLCELIDQILSVGQVIQRGQHLIVLNWPLLTRIQVALFFIMADQFEEVGFVKPVHNYHGLFFSEFKGAFNEETINNARNIVSSSDVLAILPVTELTREPIYSMIVAHNINVMRESSIYHLQAIH